MKLKTFIAVAAIALFVAACGSTYRATDTGLVITADARNSFDDLYPNSTNVVWRTYDPDEFIIVNEWELTGWDVLDMDDYIVEFDYDGEKHYAWFDRDGNWIGTAMAVNDFTTMPAVVNTTISTHYPGYTITNVNKEIHKNMTAYEVTLKSSDSKVIALVDANGNIVKYKKKPLD